MSIQIGTSGWTCDPWKGRFYPQDLPNEGRLAYYAAHFSSVEINHSFYRLPEKRNLRHGHDRVPPDFVFAAKAGRYITHMKKLREAAQSVTAFFERIEGLADKPGPVPFQLPPQWHVHASRLQSFLDALPDGHGCAFELRDPGRHCSEIHELLEKYRAALCIFDLDQRLSPKPVTANFLYLRLHGPDGAYRGQYGKQIPAGRAGAVSTWSRQQRAIYCCFDNDQNGCAARDAVKLQEMLLPSGEKDLPAVRRGGRESAAHGNDF